MGATCSIMAAHRAPKDSRVDMAAVKLVVTQHPGICGECVTSSLTPSLR